MTPVRWFVAAVLASMVLAAVYVALFLAAARQSAGDRVTAADGGWRDLETADYV